MNTGEKIDYMIACLKVAKEEYEYGAKYKAECPDFDDEHDAYIEYVISHRNPNMALVRENLRNVSRTGFQMANDIGKFEV